MIGVNIGKLFNQTALGTIKAPYVPNFALQFDGTQNYLSLGTMGNFGSNLGNGFYTKFKIATTSIVAGQFGIQESSGQAVFLNFNKGGTANKFDFQLIDSGFTNLEIVINALSPVINDGAAHTMEITCLPATHSVVVNVDNTLQTINSNTNSTPSTFSNWAHGFLIGASNNKTFGQQNYFACTVDNLLIGTSSSVLYGNYPMNEGAGTTTADTSGNGNTGTLTGSPLPTWAAGL